jgi:TPR repeat protein
MYKDIVPWVMSRADHNDPKSQWVAAEMIIRSRGYDQCGLQGEALRKAQTLLQRSAEQGYEPAELRLSQIVAAASKRIRSGAKP